MANGFRKIGRMGIVIRRQSQLSILLAFCLVPLGAVTVNNIAFNQVDYYNNGTLSVTRSAWGEFDVTYTQDATGLQWLNVVQIPATGPQRWIVQNHPLLSTLDTGTTSYTSGGYFNLGVLNGTDLVGTTFPYVYTITSAPVTSMPSGGTTGTAAIGSTQNIINNGVPSGSNTLNAPGGQNNPTPGGIVMKTIHVNVPNVRQELNWCGPGAAANSIFWLTGGVKGETITLTQAELASEMMTFHDGTWDDQLVKGKLQYIKDPAHPLAINVRYALNSNYTANGGGGKLPQTGNYSDTNGTAVNGGPLNWTWIQSELQNGEDVEFMTNTHWVVVEGMTTIGSNHMIEYRDDPFQHGPLSTAADQAVLNSRHTWTYVTDAMRTNIGNGDEPLQAVVSESFNVEARTVLPNTGSGATQNFTATYSDTAGASDIQAASLSIGSSLFAANSCSVTYIQASNQLFLDNDAGTGTLGPITAGTANTLSNSQCTLSASGGLAKQSDNILIVPFNITFTPTFTGLKPIWGYAQNYNGDNSGYSRPYLGTWTPTTPTTPTVHLNLSVPSTATAGTPFGLVVTAVDMNNNVVQNFNDTVHVTSSDTKATVPPDSTLTNGIGTFPIILKTAGSQNITATDVITPTITVSDPVTVIAAPASDFLVTAPSMAIVGASNTITLQAKDAFGNTATGYTGMVNFGSTDTLAALPPISPLPEGVGTFPVIFGTIGNQNVTATDTNNHSIIGTSNPVNVQPSGFTTPPATSISLASTVAPMGSILPAELTIGWDLEKCSQVMILGTTPPPVVTVTLTSQDPTRILLSPDSKSPASPSITVNVPECQQPKSQPFLLYGQPGTTQVTASIPGGPSTTVNETSYATMTWGVGGGTVFSGETKNFNLSLVPPAVAPLSGFTVSLTSNSPGVVTVPGTAMFMPGTNTVGVPVTSVGQGGTAQIQATAPGVSPAYLNVTIPSVSIGPSFNISVNPSSGSGFGPVTFYTTYTNSKGASDIQIADLEIGNSSAAPHSCFAVYVPATNSLYLLNDTNSATLGPITPGGTGTVSNSQCTISGAGGLVTTTSNTVTVPINVTFNPAYTGTKNIFGMAQSYTGTNSGWVLLGNWTPSVGNGTPLGVSVSPSSGSGFGPQKFTAVVSDPNGASDVNTTYVQFSDSSAAPHSCFAVYVPATNSLYLLNDTNSATLGPITPGGTGTVSNSQCTISGAGGLVTTTSNTITVPFSVTFNSAFTGQKNIFGSVQSYSGANSVWTLLGNWTP